MSGAANTDIEVQLTPARELDLAADWRDLEARADGSFFQSWRWIGSWLAELPGDIEPLCLSARSRDATVGLALLTPCRVRRQGLVTARQLHLNASGRTELDRLTIEHNGFLVDRGAAGPVAAAMFRHLAREAGSWEELVLPGVTPGFAAAATALGCRQRLVQRSLCPYVDLAALGSGDYLDQLSPELRRQIRRAHRLYGEPRLDPATDVAQAMAFFGAMVGLHEARWAAAGQPGAFAGDFAQRFHRRLVAEGVAAGDVQLLRVRAGDGRSIGYLYNFVHRRRVYAYQSGLERPADNRLKPGLVSHHLAIAMNRAAGRHVYDFLAGDSRYKRSLSNRTAELVWTVAQRPALKFAIENGARAARALARRAVGR